MNFRLKSIPDDDRRTGGYTLVETLLALMVFGMLSSLALSTLFFFNQIQAMSGRFEDENRAFEKIHLYFQRQIERSETICIKDGQVYLQDMETAQYYNLYRLKETGMLYRIKTGKTLEPIGAGESSQFERGLKTFSLKAIADGQGCPTGYFLLQVVFKEEEGKVYEAIIEYPGSVEQIVLA